MEPTQEHTNGQWLECAVVQGLAHNRCSTNLCGQINQHLWSPLLVGFLEYLASEVRSVMITSLRKEVRDLLFISS